MKQVTPTELHRFLTTHGIDCTLEYPGYVAIPLRTGQELNVGTANDEWGCDLVFHDEPVHSNVLSSLNAPLEALLAELLRFTLDAMPSLVLGAKLE